MAVITVSYQHGSGGEAVGREISARLGFDLVTPEKVSEIIRERYQFDCSLLTPRAPEHGKLLGGLISAVLTDMAILTNVVVLECGGAFVFRSYPNSLHVRIMAARETRARNIVLERHAAIAPDAVPGQDTLREVDEQDRRRRRFLQTCFRRSADVFESYDLAINTDALESEAAAELVIAAARIKRLEAYGMIYSETVERLRVRNQVRLQQALAKVSPLEAQPGGRFAHPSELVFARLLDFYGIRWEYEAKTFPLRVDEQGAVVEAFSPDFYLPDSDLYVELTTMKQSLVTRKNRKMRLLRELHPEIRIVLLYQKDFEDILFKYAVRKPLGDARHD